MGCCRDYNLVVDLVGEGINARVLGQPGDKKCVDKYIGVPRLLLLFALCSFLSKILTHFQASEDARSEGIRWVEYCGANGAPQAT